MIFWDVKPCSPVVQRRFERIYCLLLQGRRINYVSKPASSNQSLVYSSVLNIEAVRPSETSVEPLSQYTESHMPENEYSSESQA
jgi:hypothetical protein